MKTTAYLTVTVLMAAILTGCATATSFVRLSPDYSQIPDDALMAVALEVEQAVLAGERDPVLRDREGVIIDRPELVQAVRTRALRNELVLEMRAAGFAYENEAGLIVLAGGREYRGQTTRRERDRHALVVMSENENRWQLYEGLLKANNWPPRSLSAVQETFAAARRQTIGN